MPIFAGVLGLTVLGKSLYIRPPIGGKGSTRQSGKGTHSMQEGKFVCWCIRQSACLVMLLFVLALGCKNQPNLKPAKQPDELNLPPVGSHYDLAGWPDKLMQQDDAPKKQNNQDPFANGKGGMGGMGAAGMNASPTGVGGMSPYTGGGGYR